MRLGLGEIVVIVLLIFLLFGNFSKIKQFYNRLIKKIKNNLN
jgi:Sec-independent protein translocase protein TatA